jgi:hypothetical protein
MTEEASSGQGSGFPEKLKCLFRKSRLFQKPRLVFFRESWGGGMTGRHGVITVTETDTGAVIIRREETGPGVSSRCSSVIAAAGRGGPCLARIQQIFDKRVCRLLSCSPRIPFLILDKENRYYVFRWDNGREWSCDTGHFLTPGFREAIREINEAIIRAEESGNPGLEQISDSGDREL